MPTERELDRRWVEFARAMAEEPRRSRLKWRNSMMWLITLSFVAGMLVVLAIILLEAGLG